MTIKTLLISTTFILFGGYRANASLVSACSATYQETITGVVGPLKCVMNYGLGPSAEFDRSAKGLHVFTGNIVDMTVSDFDYDQSTVVTSFNGISQVDARQYFIVTGGTGAGTITGTTFWGYETGQGCCHEFAIAVINSNIMDLTGPPPNTPVPISFSFTFGQPFALFVSNRLVFGQAGPPSPSVSVHAGLYADATFDTVLDSHGNPVPNAVVSATNPEPATWNFLMVGLAFGGALSRMRHSHASSRSA